MSLAGGVAVSAVPGVTVALPAAAATEEAPMFAVETDESALDSPKTVARLALVRVTEASL